MFSSFQRKETTRRMYLERTIRHIYSEGWCEEPTRISFILLLN